MSYSRHHSTTRYFNEGGGGVVQYFRAIDYDVMKKVKGHYPDANNMNRDSWEYTFWESRTRTTSPSDPNPEYASNDPISVLANVTFQLQNCFIPDSDRVNNKAYGNFIGKMKDSAQNANNALEAGQSLGQIISHVQSISASVHAIKRGDVRGAAKALGVSISGSTEQRIKRRAKQAADRWLELHFGWEPLVQDIGSSIDILQGTGKSSPYTDVRLKSGASGSGSTHDGSVSIPGGNLLDTQSDSFSWTVGCRVGGVVSVENPNVAIANQMGFVNPLSVAWEAVPFSFVADWFSNVGQCLSAMTDMWGYQLHHGCTSTKAVVMYVHQYTREQVIFNPQLVKEEGYGIKFVHIYRVGHLITPVFRFTPFKGFSLARGATAISLLVQQMHGL
ncbi:TPA_asm: maturation protein [ssRNA phage Zoerhiza.1_38]|uniref:Maturation protein n=2 Tax=Fiersviridae TaxID=2842319 RepID=A0A8S5KZ26_9VIRU|nr:maturation protein [ssRNA phage Zoerhiza.1_38]QDH87594.1 MAG: hypothetical protein H1Rhizo27823_000002 [Leviviridae sp.]DAD50106.1 TPA_asm: maturation protein [ssRNA phage Zoerhiza.1_38]